ncbi:MAG: hypothetical protein JW940_33950 [Polyangiaceae bacterium]|nr:hypothetical protein [Polyangiaceae bacterium]
MGHDDSTVSRRDTLKLAAVVGALGAGLGALLEAEDARAEDVKIEPKALGTVALKVYDMKDGAYWLAKSFDVTEFIKLKLARGEKAHGYSIKWFYVDDKWKEGALLSSQEIAVTSTNLKMR